ncbi:hypothetical protein F4779DRAFT_621014 [Xylariaceae sp. FL0662B]|nr:hypothetical protein F4779DRAFT_621014 [Xylariaceae sp. FL0662B]
MAGIDALVGLASPAKSVSYVYGDVEVYLDSTDTSTTTSPINSPYDMSYQGMYSSPEHTEGSTETNQSESQQPAAKPAAKRKRENRYKNAPPSVLSRRRAQNRASQRAYRERKDQRIKDLEFMLSEAQQKNDVLSQAYSNLQAEYIKLKSEQDTASHYQQPGLTYDPTIGTATGDMDVFLYGDPANYL